MSPRSEGLAQILLLSHLPRISKPLLDVLQHYEAYCLYARLPGSGTCPEEPPEQLLRSAGRSSGAPGSERALSTSHDTAPASLCARLRPAGRQSPDGYLLTTHRLPSALMMLASKLNSRLTAEIPRLEFIKHCSLVSERTCSPRSKFHSEARIPRRTGSCRYSCVNCLVT